MNWSKYQQDVFSAVSGEKNNLLLSAVAGSGKTTTIVEAARSCPGSLFLAFNKGIAETLKNKGLQASTFHSLGYKALARKRWTVNENKMRNILRYKVLSVDDSDKESLKEYYDCSGYFAQMASLLKGEGVYVPGSISEETVQTLADHHCLDREQNDVYTLREMFQHNEEGGVIDFDDMLRADGGLTIYPTVFVDESQDLNKAQRGFLRRISRRVVAVGDRNQAIYGFRGASPESMDELAIDFRMKELPLSICYRCSKAVVREAAKLQPTIEFDAGQSEGGTYTISRSHLLGHLRVGDFVVCRTTAPLVELFFQLLRAGTPSYVVGLDQERYITMIKTIVAKYGWNYSGIEAYKSAGIRRLEGKRFETERFLERMLVVQVFYDSTQGKNPIDACEAMFNGKNGVRLSTIHRVKGLEADRVFLIHPELLPHPAAQLSWQLQQEDNLKYVAITRAKKEFYYVET